MYMLHIQCCI